MYYISYTYDF